MWAWIRGRGRVGRGPVRATRSVTCRLSSFPPGPQSLASETTHRFSANSFKLHRLPMPRPNEVLGLVGTNGIGKSTALKILSGKLKPNLGRFDAPPEWADILKHWRGSELQNYFSRVRALPAAACAFQCRCAGVVCFPFPPPPPAVCPPCVCPPCVCLPPPPPAFTPPILHCPVCLCWCAQILEDSLKAVMKPQYVDHIPKSAKGKVGHYMTTKGKDHPERVEELMSTLQLEHVADREVPPSPRGVKGCVRLRHSRGSMA